MNLQFGEDALAGAAAVAAAAPARDRCLFALTPTGEECGVESFARLLVNRLQAAYPEDRYGLLAISGWRDLPAICAKIARADRIVFSVPLVAWKNVLLLPVVILLFARLARCQVSVFMHEWTALHRLRRIALAPFVLLSHSIIVVSPFIADGLSHNRWLAGAAKKCRLVPNAPTVLPPQQPCVTERVRRLRAAAARSDIVVGFFGAIYQGKAATALLDLCRHLRDRGMRALIVFIGSFMKSLDGYEQQFWAKVAEHGIADQVIVTGYIADEAELYALFAEVGAFLFLFPEGLTARRSSVIHCLQSDRPVVVTAPRSMAEFAHHPGFAALIEAGALSFVPPGADLATIADRLLAAAQQGKRTTPLIDGDAWWNATTAATRAALMGAELRP